MDSEVLGEGASGLDGVPMGDEGVEQRLRERLGSLEEKPAAGPSVDSKNEGSSLEKLARNNYIFFGIIAVILIIDILGRTTLLSKAGFFEPDGFYHFSVIRAAILYHHFAIPRFLSISGFPTHFPITEPDGLYLVTIVPYMLLQFFGISYYNVMRVVPVAFGIFDAIGAYFLIQYFHKSRVLGLLGMFFVAVSSGDIARTAALVYRGDGFITIFMVVALILAIEAVKKDGRRMYISALLSGIVLGVGTAVWNGAPFTVVVYLLAIFLISIYAYVKPDKKVAKSSILLMGALLVAYALQHLWMYLYVVRVQEAFSSLHFFVFYLPVLAIAAFAYYYNLHRDSRGFASSPFGRISSSMAGRAELILVIIIVGTALVSIVYGSYLLRIASGDGLVIAQSHLNKSIEELARPSLAFLWASFSYALILAPIGIVVYILFSKRIEGKKGYGITPEFIMIAAYLGATGYLQANAVRFNSLVAVPIAIFAAYSFYAIGRVISIKVKTSMNLRKIGKIDLRYAYYGLVSALLILVLVQTLVESSQIVQADDINPLFLGALSWMKNNTAANATVLAVWPDGSVIEGWANRTSSMDSVGGQIATNIYNFSRYILNSSPDTQYLYKIDKPDYILVRKFWFDELSGIAEEGNITDPTNYGFEVFSSLSSASNTTEIEYKLDSNTPGAYQAMMIFKKNATSVTFKNSSFIGYLGIDGRYDIPLDRVLLYSPSTDQFNYYNEGLKNVSNYTMVLDLSNGSIEGAMLVSPGLFKTNMFKMIYMCNIQNCTYSGNNVSLHEVYYNPDTEIFKVNYTG